MEDQEPANMESNVQKEEQQLEVGEVASQEVSNEPQDQNPNNDDLAELKVEDDQNSQFSEFSNQEEKEDNGEACPQNEKENVQELENVHAGAKRMHSEIENYDLPNNDNSTPAEISEPVQNQEETSKNNNDKVNENTVLKNG